MLLGLHCFFNIETYTNKLLFNIISSLSYAIFTSNTCQDFEI